MAEVNNNTTSSSSTTSTTAAAAAAVAAGDDPSKKRRKRRWGDAAANETAASTAVAAAPLDPKAKVLAMQESIRARLAAAKAKQAVSAAAAAATATGATTTTTTLVSLKRPLDTSTDSSRTDTVPPPTTKRAKVYNLDMSVTAPPLANNKPKGNPYLAHVGNTAPSADAFANNDNDTDDRLVRTSKPRPRHKALHFVEPGTYQELAQRKRGLAAAAAASGFTSGRKVGHTLQAAAMSSVYGKKTSTSTSNSNSNSTTVVDDDHLAQRADAHTDTTMPLAMEWWDVELLPTKLKKQVAAVESQKLTQQTKAALPLTLETSKDGSTPAMPAVGGGDDINNDNDDAIKPDLENTKMQALQQQCLAQASLSYSKTAALVQHIVPVKPPNARTGPAKQAVLHLTKKELKRQRKLRRQEKQRELQDLQAAGLVPAPEPRLTLQNFIQVLGDQAFLDPSQMEQKVASQVQARQTAHLERNQASKLTKEQRTTKRTKKLQEDTTEGVTVAVFYVKDMGHPYHRTKVDLNAQQNFLTGGVLECADPRMACVVCEGGPKAVKRYVRLMTIRMKWQGPDGAHDEDYDGGEKDQDQEEEAQFDEDGEPIVKPKFDPENKCELVWQGMAVKRMFKGFVFQACDTSAQARNVLKAKGVAHYWDQVLQHASGRGDILQFKLASTNNNSDDDNEADAHAQPDEDIVMKEF